MKTFGIISLGCPRNLVDSEVIAGSLKREGLKMADVSGGVDICIINTCSFIEPAREESIDAIMEAASLKRAGRIKRLVVCGCLPQRYKDALADELREADLIVGTGDIPKIALLVRQGRPGARRSYVSDHAHYLYDESSPRTLMTPRHYAYIKISEGCSNFCSYCIISRLRGAFRSRTMKSVRQEVEKLSRGGSLKEIDLIGQDTTLFGMDRYGKPALAHLLKDLGSMKGSVEWVRVMYTHPAHYTDDLIAAIRDGDRICKYLDLPVQHIADRVLAAMNRRTTKRGILELIARLRRSIPGLVLRTSVIVGFPGETDREFRELLDFIRDARFEKLGAFLYCAEEGTAASKMARQVPMKEKERRYDEVMKLQQRISAEANRALKGSRVKVLIDEEAEGRKGVFLGRTERDAPEIDGAVYVSGKGVRVGEFCTVEITDALEYDLVGKRV